MCSSGLFSVPVANLIEIRSTISCTKSNTYNINKMSNITFLLNNSIY